MDKPQLKTEELELEGFHCADCAVTIEQTVAKMNGVEDVKASFTSGKVKVSYVPAEVTHADLVRSVEKIGYRVSREAHKNIERKALWKDREVRFTALSGLLLAVGLV
ncbi:MAG: cation-translocating P-type ATPase, partial [Calditrichaeota bacterium]